MSSLPPTTTVEKHWVIRTVERFERPLVQFNFKIFSIFE